MKVIIDLLACKLQSIIICKKNQKVFKTKLMWKDKDERWISFSLQRISIIDFYGI